MTNVANLHIRDVPPDAVGALKAAARRRRRSLNAEVVDAIVERAEKEQQAVNWLEELEEVQRRWQKEHPEGFEPGFEPETIIRRFRDGGY